MNFDQISPGSSPSPSESQEPDFKRRMREMSPERRLAAFLLLGSILDPVVLPPAASPPAPQKPQFARGARIRR